MRRVLEETRRADEVDAIAGNTALTFGLSEADLRDSETWRKVSMEYTKASKERARPMVETIHAIRADLWAICGLPLLGQWIREANRLATIVNPVV